MSGARPRAREVGLHLGRLPPGPLNAITDVEGVSVGHVSVVIGQDVRTGVTAILPHEGDLFDDQVQAAAFVLNGFGKTCGLPQVAEPLMDTLFQGAVEAVEEAVINAILCAETVTGRAGHVRHALPLEPAIDLLRRAGRLQD